MKAPVQSDIMNALSRSVLTLYSYDNNPDDISLPNVTASVSEPDQCISSSICLWISGI